MAWSTPLGQPAVAARVGDRDEPVRLERAQVVVDLLARNPDPRGQRRGRAGLAQLGQQPGAHRVQRDRGGGGSSITSTSSTPSIEALTRILVKTRSRASRSRTLSERPFGSSQSSWRPSAVRSRNA